jgi:hypothetical protein
MQQNLETELIRNLRLRCPYKFSAHNSLPLLSWHTWGGVSESSLTRWSHLVHQYEIIELFQSSHCIVLSAWSTNRQCCCMRALYAARSHICALPTCNSLAIYNQADKKLWAEIGGDGQLYGFVWLLSDRTINELNQLLIWTVLKQACVLVLCAGLLFLVNLSTLIYICLLGQDFYQRADFTSKCLTSLSKSWFERQPARQRALSLK